MEADSVTLSQDGICKYGECLNRPGSYECQCYDGYENRGEGCVDVDECADRCLQHGTCTNYEGSYRCDCDDGFEIGEDGNCHDIDECGSDGGPCGSRAKCVNTAGSYR